MNTEKNTPLSICDTVIQPGERVTLAMPTPEIYTCAPSYIPIHILHGKRQGPCLLICAAIHGDELNGTAIIQKLLEKRVLKKLSGTLIAIPVTNIFGLIAQSRLLVDKRDLDGAFPGHEMGSFSARLAHQLTTAVLTKATHCIDIHTGEVNSPSVPHVETNVDQEENLSLAKAFHPHVIVHTESKRGLLWQTYTEKPIPTIIYEGGEAIKIDRNTVGMGLRGCIRIMRKLNMLPSKGDRDKDSLTTRSIISVHAPASGLCELIKFNGSYVKKNEKIATITDPFGTNQKYDISAPTSGVIMSCNTCSLTTEGDTIMRIAESSEPLESLNSNWMESQAMLDDAQGSN